MANIMIVDNSFFMRVALKSICEQAGHKVVGMAADGKDAVRLYGEVKPDMVTMDILMEEMDGIQALGEIKKRYPNAIVLMVTIVEHAAKMEEALRLGAAGYITKPFIAAEIAKEIDKAMAKRS